ncbi:TniQ family protein [Azospirillum rugosum]|uniref:TniQ family protein n=1 Tax=Azospirillum rugosum TaxID=416170 RepID=UPI00366D8031
MVRPPSLEWGPLPLTVQPLEDELLSSWLGRLAALYAVPADAFRRRLAHACGVTTAPVWDELNMAPASAELAALAHVGRIDAHRLSALTLGHRFPHLRTCWVTGIHGRPVPHCWKCLNNDWRSTGVCYLRHTWALAFETVCPVHRELLVRSCPDCHASVQHEFLFQDGRTRIVCGACKFPLDCAPPEVLGREAGRCRAKSLTNIVPDAEHDAATVAALEGGVQNAQRLAAILGDPSLGPPMFRTIEGLLGWLSRPPPRGAGWRGRSAIVEFWGTVDTQRFLGRSLAGLPNGFNEIESPFLRQFLLGTVLAIIDDVLWTRARDLSSAPATEALLFILSPSEAQGLLSDAKGWLPAVRDNFRAAHRAVGEKYAQHRAYRRSWQARAQTSPNTKPTTGRSDVTLPPHTAMATGSRCSSPDSARQREGKPESLLMLRPHREFLALAEAVIAVEMPRLRQRPRREWTGRLMAAARRALEAGPR